MSAVYACFFVGSKLPLLIHYINMTTKPRRKPKRPTRDYQSIELRQPAVDLFGDVVVTNDDIYDWVAAVSPVHLSERGFDLYVSRYDVAGKVRAAKLADRFDSIVATRRPPYHARLALQAIL